MVKFGVIAFMILSEIRIRSRAKWFYQKVEFDNLSRFRIVAFIFLSETRTKNFSKLKIISFIFK